ARGNPAAVLALAPQQPGQYLLLRRIRRLHQAGEVEGVLVRAGQLRTDPVLRGALRRAHADAAGLMTMGANLSTLPSAWREAPTLRGRHVALEPLRATHAAGLRAALGEGELSRLW